MFLISEDEQPSQSIESLAVFWHHSIDTLSEDDLGLPSNHVLERNPLQTADVACVVDDLFVLHPSP